jgi:hypothetical protein
MSRPTVLADGVMSDDFWFIFTLLRFTTRPKFSASQPRRTTPKNRDRRGFEEPPLPSLFHPFTLTLVFNVLHQFKVVILIKEGSLNVFLRCQGRD